MPTIHIHIPDDHSVVGDIVVTLLQWDDLTITIDQRDAYIARSWDEIAARDVAARAATKPTAGAFDLTCKCGPDHDDCAVDCQCSCHDLPDMADVVAQRGSIDRLAKPTAGASTEEIKSYVAARAATDEPHPVVLTIGEQERRNLRDTWTVRCPKCNAGEGWACQGPKGDSYGMTFVHNARRQALQAARRIVLDEV